MGVDIETSMKVTNSSTTLVSKSGQPVVTAFQRTLWVLNTLYYVILGIVSLIFLWIFCDLSAINDTQYTLHLILSTAAYVPLMAVAIFVFAEDNVAALYIPRTKRYSIHGILLLISCVAASIGMAVMVVRKSENNRSHFTSKHGKYGLASWVLLFASVLTGIFAANTRFFSKVFRPVILKLFHNLLGLAGFAMGIAATYVMVNHLRNSLSSSALTGMKVGLIYVTIWSAVYALKSLYGQIKGVFS
ncbi:transmembrane reductase CYB561D2 [Anthonomus grandis grandis]|uniref:transmembrane reductase CYB561D2 n=1 Tax=Anthonomus grandis grandis TaxID=2921223 RepID=UPI002166873B|nr:transmembrane reductase CYB561D2 [Anthonomus grandis grandis]